jgi:AcrR family transcriptional regulator
MASPRRERLVDTATELFYRNGYHATGIDRIVAEAGVAKMTLYKHFRSKDELILAVLRRRDETFRNWLMGEVDRRGASPRERLLVLFDVLQEWFRKNEYRGCMFINAGAEYGAPDSAIRAVACEHKRLLSTYVEQLAREAGATDPAELAAGLTLLVDGATVAAQLNCDCGPAEDARRAGAVLIAAGIPAN